MAFTVGGSAPHGAFVAREYWIRRLVMARHLEAARFGVRVALDDDAVILDFGLDLAKTSGGVVDLGAALAEVEADSLRADESGAMPQL
ncbi:hypothetical protein Q6346_15245 [Isoptericola sp. b490]|uniref:hypothetical protein n=1 Tax=Actinotalea lenta TaxID=3064654 RepID=UPI002713155B|nr:hypothetical protein [Isoptericola sp. b490]MDO8122663.1 hypothetical protein [Isoptericola sp. b490]